MADVRPFKGWFYNTSKVGQLADVVAPPYDVISPAEAEELYARSTYNVAHLILGRQTEDDTDVDNRYTRAAHALADWRRDGVLVRHEVPAFYAYEFNYWLGGSLHTMRGLMGLVALREFEQGDVLPHEHTFPGPKADRLALMQACKGNLDQIYSTFGDSSGIIHNILKRATASPFEKVDDAGGSSHALAAITDEADVATISGILAEQTLYIADGHHRYETALNYAKVRRLEVPDATEDAPFNFIPMLLVDTLTEDVSVLPTHRVIHNLPGLVGGDFLEKLRELFVVEERASLKATLAAMREYDERHCFGLYLGGRFYSTVLRDESDLDRELPAEASAEWKRLDVAILQRLVVEKLLDITHQEKGKSDNISYTEDELDAVQTVDEGRAVMCILLNPTKMAQVEAVARNGEKMPQKSTYFYPKPLTGMIFNTHD